MMLMAAVLRGHFVRHSILLLTLSELNLFVSASTTFHGPCFACQIYKIKHPKARNVEKVELQCSYPCSCSRTVPECPAGVPTIKDGCGCCSVCPRQPGDACQALNPCDQHLYCDFGPANQLRLKGICRTAVNVTLSRYDMTRQRKVLQEMRMSRGTSTSTMTVGATPRPISTSTSTIASTSASIATQVNQQTRESNSAPCIIDGKKYPDGSTFNLTCRWTCHCKNARHGCSDACEGEHHPPAEDACPGAKLVAVAGRCCKEWECMGYFNDTPSPIVRDNGDLQIKLKQIRRVEGKCSSMSTEWTSCSTPCGLGTSQRLISSPPSGADHTTCQVRPELRYCLIRPCAHAPYQVLPTSSSQHHRHHKNGRHQEARSTRIRHTSYTTGDRVHLQFDGCRSVDTYPLRFCSVIERTHTSSKTSNWSAGAVACKPVRTRTRAVRVLCGKEGGDEHRLFMFINRCSCFK